MRTRLTPLRRSAYLANDGSYRRAVLGLMMAGTIASCGTPGDRGAPSERQSMKRAIATHAGAAESTFVLGQGVARWTPTAWATPAYESSPTFTPDSREAFFMRADASFRNYRILWSRCENGRWTVPAEAPFAAPAPVQEADPALSEDGRRLYYISTRHAHPGEDFDIWVVDRRDDESWGEPRRLLAPVNSDSSELLPRPASGGRLYFGSSRSGGYGQSDIYVARADRSRDGVEAWTVENVGPPVSTSANEYEADVSRDGRTLVVVADRGDRSHLYRFVRQQDRWVAHGRIPADPRVFQVGPLLSPTGDRVLFAQADGDRSGELFVADLQPGADPSWPPRCGG